MTIKILIMFLSIMQFNSCAQNLGNRDEAKKINNSAMELSFGTTDTSKILISIKMLDKAISIDSSYFLTYSNKISLLFRLNKNLEVIETVNRLSKFVGENSLILFIRGIAYKKEREDSLSDYNLKSALEMSAELKNDFDKMMYSQLLVYFEGKKMALNKCNQLLNDGIILKDEFIELQNLIQSVDDSDPLGINQ